MNLELPKNEIIKTPEVKIKEGVDFVFEQNHELKQIGTKEQYSEYLDTVFPDSKVKDIVYHGSASTFDEFDNTSKDIKSKAYGTPDNVVFFTTNYNVAKQYFENIPLGTAYKGGEKIYSAIVNISNSYEVDFKGADYRGVGYEVIDKETGLSTMDEFDIESEYFSSKSDILRTKQYQNARQFYTINEVTISNRSTDEIAVYARKNGFDSTIIKNVIEQGTLGDDIAVFNSSKQIHRLGSNQDIEKFKEFISESKPE
jgi:hypothetical protein